MKEVIKTNDLKTISDRLNSSKLDKLDLLGLICFIVYSKEIFLKNKDISVFLKDVFNLTFLQYVFNTRTSIVARLTKHINLMTDIEIIELRNKLLIYFTKDTYKDTKKKNANEKLETWLKGL